MTGLLSRASEACFSQHERWIVAAASTPVDSRANSSNDRFLPRSVSSPATKTFDRPRHWRNRNRALEEWKSAVATATCIQPAFLRQRGYGASLTEGRFGFGFDAHRVLIADATELLAEVGSRRGQHQRNVKRWARSILSWAPSRPAPPRTTTTSGAVGVSSSVSM